MKARRRRHAGFTLIELMVALAISTILVGMILSIFSRMSLAYRGQQQISSVQQVLAAARASFELDAKQVGLEMPQGYWMAPDNTTRHSPLELIDQANTLDPDEIKFVYADASMQAMVALAPPSDWINTHIDVNPGFVVGDLVVVSTPTAGIAGVQVGDAQIATFDACVVKIAAIDVTGLQLTFSTTAPWGSANNTHCTLTTGVPAPARSMVYKLAAHAYRIDPNPARAVDGVLQMSPSGDLKPPSNDWQDLGNGFTDIQAAVQFFDNNLADEDGDGDNARDFYSGAGMATMTAPTAPGTPFTPPIQLSITLVARTDKEVEGIATGATPKLLVPARINNNRLGNHDIVILPSATDTHLQGSRIYRYTTFVADLRNMGVGR